MVLSDFSSSPSVTMMWTKFHLSRKPSFASRSASRSMRPQPLMKASLKAVYPLGLIFWRELPKVASEAISNPSSLSRELAKNFLNSSSLILSLSSSMLL